MRSLGVDPRTTPAARAGAGSRGAGSRGDRSRRCLSLRPSEFVLHGLLGLRCRAVCCAVPRRLERRGQARARSARHHDPDVDRRRAGRPRHAAVHRVAGERGLALGHRLGADPSRLFRGADRKLRRRRHGSRLSARARLGAADDGDRRRRCCSRSSSGSLGWVGIAVLAAGVLLLSLRGGRDLAHLDRRAIGLRC